MRATARPRRKRYEEIAEHLELSILSDRIAVGSRLPSERDLMEQFGVGRSTVREALFRLQRMGLITLSQGAPARAARPTAEAMVSELSGAARHFLSIPDGVRHFQHARTMFEVSLAREAALRADDTKLARLSEALAANRAAIGNQERFIQTDLDFHATLARMTGNPIFTALTQALAEWLGKQREVSARGGATQMDVYEQHAAIYDAIAARDAVRAQQAMEDHLRQVARRYWRAMADIEGDLEERAD
jgi:GntR family transcriptional repressor for pyruvate dehydrogenase complex